MTSPPNTDSYPTEVLVLSTQSGIAGVGGPSAGETDRSQLFPCSPCSGRSSSTWSASSLPALRNDSGEAFWRLTWKAMNHLGYYRDPLYQEASRIAQHQSRGSGVCELAGTSKASACV